MQKKILYIGNFSYPNLNAAGKRVYGNAMLMKELGYEVVFIGLKKDSKNIIIEDKETNHDFKVYNINYPKNLIEWMNFYDPLKKIKEIIKIESKVDIIILYGSIRISFINFLLIQYAKKNKIKILSDCVDWLTVRTTKKIFNFCKNLDTFFQKAYLNKKVDGLIVISKYLKNYYNNLEVSLIPPLSIEVNREYLKEQNAVLTILYAGIPFRKGKAIQNKEELKDRIDVILYLFNEVKKRNITFILKIYGFTKEEYLKVLPEEKEIIIELDKNIQFYGEVKNEIIIEELKKADYTILIRDRNRDTTAGFPTKVSESISAGVRVITNLTSDIEDYLNNNNSILLKENQKENVDILVMEFSKKNINKIVDETFYYKNKKYVKELKKIL